MIYSFHWMHQIWTASNFMNIWFLLKKVPDSPWPGWWWDPWRWTPARTGRTAGSCAAAPVCPEGRRRVPPVPWPCRSVADSAWCCRFTDTETSWKCRRWSKPSATGESVRSSGACRLRADANRAALRGWTLLSRAYNWSDGGKRAGGSFYCEQWTPPSPPAITERNDGAFKRYRTKQMRSSVWNEKNSRKQKRKKKTGNLQGCVNKIYPTILWIVNNFTFIWIYD